MNGVVVESLWKEHVPLAPRTSFRIGGRARFFARPYDLPSLRDVVDEAHQQGLPRFMLGGGTNVLLRDEDYPGVVVSTRRWTGVRDLGVGRVIMAPGTYWVPCTRIVLTSCWINLANFF